MSENKQKLSDVWHQVEFLIDLGFSLIPVRDKDEVVQGVVRTAKSPYRKWEKAQKEHATREQLWYEMREGERTQAIAMVCGAISGNLEIIDIDVKWKPGIDAIFFAAINEYYPELFSRLRIHRTPSGGYHIPYRITDHAPEGNEKLAGRLATPDELTASKGKNKQVFFLETRGEGGYALAPPSLGYAVHQDRPFPDLTWAERCSLINLARQYTEIIRLEKPAAVPRSDSAYYDENPFEHFNASPAGESVLQDHGWKYIGESGDFVNYAKPRDSGKANQMSAGFSKSRRLFHFFTTATEFEINKWYNPAMVLSVLLHNNDRKATYRYLVDAGYGKVKHSIEQRAIQQRAITKKPLPSNFSPQAHEQLAELSAEADKTYPYGVFWYVEEERYKINRERLYVVSEGLGFRIHNSQVCRIEGYRIVKVTPRKYFDTVKSYIQEQDAEQYEGICNAYETFLQNSGSFTTTRLPMLDPASVLTCSKNVSYKFFSNCYVSITPEGIGTHLYTSLEDKKVWDELIRPREFDLQNHIPTSSLYHQFLDKAIGMSDHLMRCVGYLAHDFKDETMGYIILLTEQCPDPKQGGGSGKNVFSSLFSETTTFKDIPGSQVQFNEKFLQSWNYERVFSISDVPKKFDFGFLKNLSTGTGILKKLFKDEITVTPDLMPKMIISTNFSYDASDGGLKRRIIPLEFTDFFTRCGGLDTYFNAMFPTDWTPTEYHHYDNIIIRAIHQFLSSGSKLQAPALTTGGLLKQFDQIYGQLTRQFIEERWEEWISTKDVQLEKFNQEYDEFCDENGIMIKYRASAIQMNRALTDWGRERDIIFIPQAKVKTNGIQYRVKQFLPVSPF